MDAVTLATQAVSTLTPFLPLLVPAGFAVAVAVAALMGFGRILDQGQ
jgi:hypothetical protein